MRKILFFIIVAVIPFVEYHAQVINGVHKKLADFYVEERWEDCSFKSERMSFQPKYENDPEVFLYLAASYNKIFLMCLEDTTLLYKYQEYVNSYNYALRYSVMAKKKDKKDKVFFPANDFMLEEIAISGIHYIDNYVNEKKKYAKASSFMRKIMKTYTDDNIYFMHGVLCAMSGDTVTANEVISEVFHRMDSVENRRASNTDFIMIEAFDFYTDFLLNREMPLKDSALNFINRGLEYFPGNEVLLYLAAHSKDPELDITKPQNKDKIHALKRVSVFIPNDEYDQDIEEEDIE